MSQGVGLGVLGDRHYIGSARVCDLVKADIKESFQVGENVAIGRLDRRRRSGPPAFFVSERYSGAVVGKANPTLLSDDW